MKIYDLSLLIKNTMLVWLGDSPVSISEIATIKKDGVALSNFNLGSHTGTHIDAPKHFIKKGKGVSSIPLEKLIGDCRVLDLRSLKKDKISASDLSKLNIKKGQRILFKTGNYVYLRKNKFPKKYVSLSLDGAKFLSKIGVSLVGTDFLGIEEQGSPGHPVHKALLSVGIAIVEGLDLEKVTAGEYKLICLPLNVDSDGSPARVVLISEKV